MAELDFKTGILPLRIEKLANPNAHNANYT
jgi:hypothetical protein